MNYDKPTKRQRISSPCDCVLLYLSKIQTDSRHQYNREEKSKHTLLGTKGNAWLTYGIILLFILVAGCDSPPLSLAIGQSSRRIPDGILEQSLPNENQQDNSDGMSDLTQDSMTFFVILKNNSKRSYLYSEESNPFGYNSVTFEARIPNSNRLIHIKKKPRELNRKANNSLVLRSGEQMVIPVMLFRGSDEWENTDEIMNTKGTEIRAIFTQRPYWRDHKNAMKVGEMITVKSDWCKIADQERINLSDYIVYEKSSWRPNQYKKTNKPKSKRSSPTPRGMARGMRFRQRPPGKRGR